MTTHKYVVNHVTTYVYILYAGSYHNSPTPGKGLGLGGGGPFANLLGFKGGRGGEGFTVSRLAENCDLSASELPLRLLVRLADARESWLRSMLDVSSLVKASVATV